MTTRLILVRHGVTEWNREYRFQGQTDIKLSREGREQALALQKRLLREKLDFIYSSDLCRAWETAEIIAEPHGKQVQFVPGMRELNFGVWEGLTYGEIERGYPELVKIWRESPHLLTLPQGESFEILRDRSVGAIETLLKTHPGNTIAVVTHGGTIAASICGLLGEPLSHMWNYKQQNTAVNILTQSSQGIKLDIFNDISHLKS